ncbi:MAG TPA: hypothetical protein VKU02_33645, partial [Gemmataceae bacterium]|nr:hypothetical protein [Gemmataceae bacterium]
TSVVSSGTTAANGPPASVGNATPSTQAVPLTVTPGAAKTPQQSNGNSGTNPTAASAYSLLRMQELADMGTMFWLDHK